MLKFLSQENADQKLSEITFHLFWDGHNKEDQAKTTDWKDVEKLVSSISVQGIMRHGDIRVDGGFLGLGQDGNVRVFHTTYYKVTCFEGVETYCD